MVTLKEVCRPHAPGSRRSLSSETAKTASNRKMISLSGLFQIYYLFQVPLDLKRNNQLNKTKPFDLRLMGWSDGGANHKWLFNMHRCGNSSYKRICTAFILHSCLYPAISLQRTRGCLQTESWRISEVPWKGFLTTLYYWFGPKWHILLSNQQSSTWRLFIHEHESK